MWFRDYKIILYNFFASKILNERRSKAIVLVLVSFVVFVLFGLWERVSCMRSLICDQTVEGSRMARSLIYYSARERTAGFDFLKLFNVCEIHIK